MPPCLSGHIWRGAVIEASIPFKWHLQGIARAGLQAIALQRLSLVIHKAVVSSHTDLASPLTGYQKAGFLITVVARPHLCVF